MLVDYIVVDPDQKQTTQTGYDPAISGEIFRPLDSFHVPEFNVQKVIARRVAQELQAGSCVNLGFGISANVPRILLEEGLHGAVTWVIEQGAVGGVPLLDFAFGCASNADAYMPSPYQFTYFQGAGFDASLLSFLEIGKDGSVNVSKLSFRPHVTAGAGGFVDITARAKKIVFSGMFNAGAKLSIADGALLIEKEGKLKKLVNKVEHVTFSGRRAIEQGQDIIYVTERCVMKLTPEGIVLTEIAPGVDLQSQILDQSEFPLIVAPDLKVMFNVPDDRKAAQVALATATLSKSFQSAFNVVKGSVPARTDVPDTDFDACGKKGIADLKAANEGGTLFGSLAQGYGAPPAIANAYKDVVSKFVHGQIKTSDEAVKQLVQAIDDAR